jgi:hypothetical protein
VIDPGAAMQQTNNAKQKMQNAKSKTFGVPLILHFAFSVLHFALFLV